MIIVRENFMICKIWIKNFKSIFASDFASFNLY